MALPEPQLRESLYAVGVFLEKRRPPVQIRHKVDYRIDIDGQQVVMLSLRPHFQNKKEIVEMEVFKARWVNKSRRWRLYWMRQSGKWQSYDPFPEGKTLREVLGAVDRDQFGCFFG